MLKMHEGGGGNLTTEQTACEFLKQQQLVFNASGYRTIGTSPMIDQFGWFVWHMRHIPGLQACKIAHNMSTSLTFYTTLSILLGEARCCVEGPT